MMVPLPTRTILKYTNQHALLKNKQLCHVGNSYAEKENNKIKTENSKRWHPHQSYM